MRPPLSRTVERIDDVEGHELSDEEMKLLLRRAEERLKAVRSAGEVVDNAPSKESPSTSALKGSIPKLETGVIHQPYIKSRHGLARADPSRLVDDHARRLSDQSKRVKNPVTVREQALKDKKASAGADWFGLPRTNLTPELAQDLRLLKLRGILDPKRHYKKENAKAQVPEYSQVGTIIEGPTEYFSSRLFNRDRKRTFVEEVMANESSTGRFKKKYNEVQSRKTSGKRDFYKKLKEKRSRGFQKP